MHLTGKQREQLKDLVTLKLPASWEKLNFPGRPERCCDMRVIPALQKRGLVECVVHEYFVPQCEAPISHDQRRVVVTYRATAAGLSAYSSSTPEKT